MLHVSVESGQLTNGINEGFTLKLNNEEILVGPTCHYHLFKYRTVLVSELC